MEAREGSRRYDHPAELEQSAPLRALLPPREPGLSPLRLAPAADKELVMGDQCEAARVVTASRRFCAPLRCMRDCAAVKKQTPAGMSKLGAVPAVHAPTRSSGAWPSN